MIKIAKYLSPFFLTVSVFLFVNLPQSSAQNLLNMSEWVVGSGNSAAFIVNGHQSHNIREWGSAPNGERAVLWKGVPAGDVQADGGWNTEVPIDHRKKYRYTVWLKKTNSFDGTSYFGCGNVANLDNSPNSNPYFWYGKLPELNKWYLLVGYVHGSSDESTTHEGAIYDGLTGQRMQGITDFKFLPSSQATLNRSYLYYDPNVNDRQYFYGPRLEVVDGTEIPLSLLFAGGSSIGAGGAGMDGNIRLGNGKAMYLSGMDPFHKITYRREMENKLIDGPVIFGWSGGALGVSQEGGDKVALQWIGNGNVGIGTATPDEKLAVKGKIRAQEIKVEATNWPDYVFENGYSLPTLEETAQFIAENGHLPEIPKASAIEADGLSLGEMNKLLLKKIEELTLHLISKDQKERTLEQRIEQLERTQKDQNNPSQK